MAQDTSTTSTPMRSAEASAAWGAGAPGGGVGAPASAVLQPGASIGTSSLQVTAPPGSLVSSALGVDNFGSKWQLQRCNQIVGSVVTK